MLLEKWEIQQQIWRADFEFVEPVQHLCCVLLSVCGEQPGHQLNGLARQYQNLIKAACQDGKYEVKYLPSRTCTQQLSSSPPPPVGGGGMG